jgi:hypothetical protein
MPNKQNLRAFCANDCGTRLRRNYIYYCSNACKKADYRNWIINAWNEGTLEAAPFFNRVLRRHLIETLGERCQRCGWNQRNPASGNIPVEIEHIEEIGAISLRRTSQFSVRTVIR